MVLALVLVLVPIWPLLLYCQLLLREVQQLGTSRSLKAYRSFGNDLVQAAIHGGRVEAQSSRG